MQNVILSSRIKEQCKMKSITIKSLLESCGMNRNTIYDLERKSIFPSSEKIARIADYLDCSVDYLLGRTDDPHEQLTSEQRTLLSLIEQLSDAEISALLALAKSLLAQHEKDQAEK